MSPREQKKAEINARIAIWIEEYQKHLEIDPFQNPYGFVAPTLGKKLETNYVSTMGKKHLAYYRKTESGKYVWQFTYANENFMKYCDNIREATNKKINERNRAKAKAKRLAKIAKKADFAGIKTSTSDPDLAEKMLAARDLHEEASKEPVEIVGDLPDAEPQKKEIVQPTPVELSEKAIEEAVRHIVKKVILDIELEVNVTVKVNQND